jgi:AcrR family transcriptional regulator
MVWVMPRPRYENMPAERKAKLLKAATRELAAHGYELASTNRILEAAELSKGAFYYYFDDKADLALTVLEALVQPSMVAFEVREVSSPAEFWAELNRVSFERLKVMEADRVGYEAIVRITNAVVTQPALVARVSAMFAPGRMKMVGFLERGVALGALRSDIPIGTLIGLIEAVKTALYKATFPGDRMPSDAEMEAFSAQVIDLARRIGEPTRKEA